MAAPLLLRKVYLRSPGVKVSKYIGLKRVSPHILISMVYVAVTERQATLTQVFSYGRVYLHFYEIKGRNYTNFKSNLAMMVMYLPVKFEFNWTKHFQVRVQKRKF